MKIRKGFPLLLAFMLAFTTVEVYAQAPAVHYYKHIITVDERDITAEPGEEIELIADIVSTDVTSEVTDPDNYRLESNEALTEGDKYSGSFTWGFEKNGHVDYDKDTVNGVTGAHLSAPDAPGTYRLAFEAFSDHEIPTWDGFKDYESPFFPGEFYLVKTRTLTVINPNPVDSVNVTPATATIRQGQTQNLTATVLPAKADQRVTWSSSDVNVATVKDGKVTAVGEGKAEITATSVKDPSRSGKAEIIVVKSVPVTKITLDPRSMTLAPGEIFEIKATVEPNEASDPGLVWSSSDDGVAAVKDGKVTAVAAGTAKITATAADDSNVSASCDVTVGGKEVESVKLDRKTVTLLCGKHVTLHVTIKPEGAVPGKLKWSTSDKKVAKVSQTGKVTAVAPGSARITVNADGKKATATIKVPSMELDTEDLVLQSGRSKTIRGTFVKDKINSAVVSKDKKGVIKKVEPAANGKSVKITANKNKTGSAHVTVTSKAGIKTGIKVTVQKAKVKTKSVKILNEYGDTKSSFTVEAGKKLTLTIKATPDQVSTGDKAKISSDNKKTASAEIKDGKLVIKGKKEGEAKITVKVGSKKKTIRVKVENK